MPRRMGRWYALVIAAAVIVPVAIASLLVGAGAGWIGGTIIWISAVPHAWREVRTRRTPARVTVHDDRCVIEHPALFDEPVEIRAEDLHSIVPRWTRRPPWWRTVARLSPGPKAPMIGTVVGGRGDALLFVMRAERRLPQARSRYVFIWPVPVRDAPIRGLYVAVEDLDAAQRAFQRWGLLARVTPGAVAWLWSRSTATSPGPLPVYGT